MIEKRFIRAISAILPLPTDEKVVSSYGIPEVDTTEAAAKIQTIIKRYTKKHNLTDAEVLQLKRLAIKRFDKFRVSWNKIKSR